MSLKLYIEQSVGRMVAMFHCMRRGRYKMKKIVIVCIATILLIVQFTGCGAPYFSPFQVIFMNKKIDSDTVIIRYNYQDDKPEFVLGEDETNKVISIFNDVDWQLDNTKTASDYVFILDDEYMIYYCSEHGIVNDEENKRHCKLSTEQKETLNMLIDSAVKM